MWLQQTGYSSRVEIIPSSNLPLYAKTFSPDGQFIYFSAAETPDGPTSLYRVPTLGGPVSKILTGLNSPVSISPDGRELVFSRWDKEKRETAFLIKPIDASGDERQLYSYKTEYAWEGSPAWSPDGKLIAFSAVATQEENRATCSLAVFPVNGGGTPTPISDERWETCYRIVWSPDGRGLYMIGTKEGDGQTTRRDQIFYISYPQGYSRRITTEGNRHLGDALGVTKDGSVIAVPFNRASQIWVMDPKGDSRSAVQITTGLNDGRAGIAPMADGRVAYVTRTGDNLAVWSMSQDGSDQRELVADPTTIEEIRSGGDGRYLVFSAVQGRYQHLFRSNTDGSDIRQLSFGNSMEVDSSISHDGKWVAYASTAHTGAGYTTTLWKVPIDGGEPTSLKRKDCEMPHFSPDDKFISCVEAQKTIHILSPDGTLFRSFTALPRSTLSFGARWTPDGKAVTYIIDNNAEISNIWLQPIDGGRARRLTDFTSGNIYHFAYSLDGTRLFLARGQQIRDAVLITRSDGKRK